MKYSEIYTLYSPFDFNFRNEDYLEVIKLKLSYESDDEDMILKIKI